MADDLDVKLVISAQNKAKAIIGELERSLGGVGKGFSVAGVAASAATAAIAATAVGIAAVGAGLAAMTVSGIKSAMTLEQNKVAFTTMLGSAEKAGEVLKDITNFAKTTPFELPEIQTSARSLLAFQVEAEKLEPTLRAVGDVASGVGAPINEIAELYGKANVQGRLFGEDINQLTGRGIPIIGELAKQFGVTEGEVKKLVEEGKVGFPELETAFQNMTSEGGMFFGMMDAQSQTATGVISNLKDSFGQLTLAIVGVDPDGTIQEGGIFDTFKNILNQVLGVLESNRDKIVEVAKVIGGGMSSALTYILDLFGKWWGILMSGIKQWKNYEGVIGKVRSTIEILVAYFKEEFIKAWNDLKKAIEPHLPELKMMAKILGGALLVAIGAVVVGTTTLILWIIKLTTWTLNARKTIQDFMKGALQKLGDAFNWVGNKLAGMIAWFVNATTTIGNTLASVVGFVVEFGNGVGQGISNVIGKIGQFRDDIKAKFNELITGALEWGRHMLQNFADGIWQGIGNVGDSLESAKNFIKEKIGFSKNKDIPSEVWGLHMMQNFAGGIEEGNEEMEAALNDAVATAQERIEAFTNTFAELKDKVKESWKEFKEATKDAKKTYRETIDDISAKTRDLKNTFKEDFAGAVLDIRDTITGLKNDLNNTNISFDQQMAEKFVDAEEAIAASKVELQSEMAKSDADRDAERIAEIQENIAEQQSFLTKHASDIKTVEDAISEERRIRGLDEVELLKEQKAQETAIIQEQINAEQAVLDLHAEQIRQYNSAIVEEKRVRGMDELSILLENFATEKTSLQAQEDAALIIKQDAMKKARKKLKKHLKNIAKDTKTTVREMAAEFNTIPDSMTAALQAVSNRLIKAGTKVAGGNTTNKNDNSKSYKIVVSGSGGENQNDLLARLGVLLKTL